MSFLPNLNKDRTCQDLTGTNLVLLREPRHLRLLLFFSTILKIPHDEAVNSVKLVFIKS